MMKKLLLALSLLTVTVVSACRPTPSGNLNNNSSGGVVPLTDEKVTISAVFVDSSPPELTLKVDKDPVHIKKTQKINWNIDYKTLGGAAQKMQVTVSKFKDSTNTEVNLFQDGSKYEFKDLPPNTSATPLTTGEAKPGTETDFKYQIVFIVNGKVKVTLDPRIVIDAGLYKEGSGKSDR
jgi:hypothetical protein